jgi:4-amino-4-deoxy-L-arabinose transferase-like glycosyltransferase
VPYFNGNYRFDKPVLTYWLMRMGYAVFGQDELGARLHSILSTIATALVILWAGTRWFSAAAGFGAAFAFLTCFQIILNGRSSTADMPMVLAVAAAQVMLFETLRQPTAKAQRPWMLGFYAVLGFGFLAKGPVAILVPAVSLLLFRFVFWRKPLPWARLKPHIGLPLMLLIVGAWGVPALVKTGGLFWSVGMNEHVVQRGMEVFHGRFYFPGFYLLTAFVSLLPWFAFAGSGWTALRANWRAENAFLVSWLAAPYLIFTFYATQLPHYVMPGFAAFFLILAQALTGPSEPRPWMRWWFRGVVAIPVVLVLLIGGLLILAWSQHAPAGIVPTLAGLTGLLLALVLMALTARYGRWRWLLAGVLIAAVSLMAVGTGMRRLSPPVQMVPVFEKMPPNAEYMGWQFMEGTLVFYGRTYWTMTRDADELQSFLQKPGPRLAVLLEKEIKLDRYLQWQLKRLIGRPGPLKVKDLTSRIDPLDTRGYAMQRVSGMNMGRFTWVTVRVYYRTG